MACGSDNGSGSGGICLRRCRRRRRSDYGSGSGGIHCRRCCIRRRRRRRRHRRRRRSSVYSLNFSFSASGYVWWFTYPSGRGTTIGGTNESPLTSDGNLPVRSWGIRVRVGRTGDGGWIVCGRYRTWLVCVAILVYVEVYVGNRGVNVNQSSHSHSGVLSSQLDNAFSRRKRGGVGWFHLPLFHQGLGLP